ncbi:MAG: hypothetical protein ACK5BE_00810 [Alphaproteobacteria bacterium]|jgi:hypothetical protein
MAKHAYKQIDSLLEDSDSATANKSKRKSLFHTLLYGKYYRLVMWLTCWFIMIGNTFAVLRILGII